jgi:predicted NUDIX family phosphoesterase
MMIGIDKYNGEQVFAFGNRDLKHVMEGPVNKVGQRILNLGSGGFHYRFLMEDNPSMKQVIPYCILRVAIDGERLYFTYRRGSKSGESRLIGNQSIGIGGHVNPCDTSLGWSKMFLKCAEREIGEEAGNLYVQSIVPSGIIYDGSNDVGRVHFGIAYVCNVSGSDVILRDGAYRLLGDVAPEIKDGQFRTKEDILQLPDVELENWSMIARSFLK